MALPKKIHNDMQSGINMLMSAQKESIKMGLDPRYLKEMSKVINEVLKLFQRSK